MTSTPLPTAHAITSALTEGRTTATAMARAILEASKRAGKQRPNLDPFVAIDEARVLAEAARADARYASKQTLGPLDGVPIGVKDHVDVEGYVTRNGASWMPDVPCQADAPIVAQLRAAGAVIVGKLHQHELGLGATGINMHYPVPRNPHDARHAPGGSSSGSGAAVALGLMPVAVAADGGGSIRIPASLCGVFGLKPTFGRTSRTAADLDPGTLAVAGPIASSVADLDLFLRATSAFDPRDASMISAPPLDLAALDRARKGEGRPLRIGIVAGEVEDADASIGRAFERALSDPALGRLLERVEVRIPSLSLARSIGYVTFGVEVAAGHRRHLELHRGRMGLDVRLIMALGERLSGSDFIHAQKHRARLRRDVDAAFAKVDLLVLPTTGCTAPVVRDAAERTGEVDDAGTAKLTRYTFMGNLCGLPAASVPIGVDPASLPIGLQLIGSAFDEATVLRAAYALERAGIAACPVAEHRSDALSALTSR